MLQRSPILRFALEVFGHSLADAASTNPRDWKMAVMSLAQSVELAIKAALVEKNVPIYEKREGTTISSRDALAELAKLWVLPRIEMQARLELLVDERNAIQHKYGSIDEVTLDYHMETVFLALRELLRREFDIELDDWIKGEVSEPVWRKIRFVSPPEEAAVTPSSSASPDRSAVLDLIGGFASYEEDVRCLVAASGADPKRLGSSLDFVIKALANALTPDQDLVAKIPDVYRLRNRVVHGFGDIPEADASVSAGLAVLDQTLAALTALPPSTVADALEASAQGIRGTRIRGLRSTPHETAPTQEVVTSPEFQGAGTCEGPSRGG